MIALRHLPLAALALAVFAGEHLAAAWTRWLRQDRPRANPANVPTSSPRLAAWLLPLTVALVLLGVTVQRSRRIVIEPQHAAFPVRAVAVLKASGVRGNMAVYFDWGEYVLWHLGPGVKVSYDGRRETIYSDALRRLNMDWANGTGRWDALLDDYPHRSGPAGQAAGRLQPHAARRGMEAGVRGFPRRGVCPE